MSKLKQRFIEDMELHGYGKRTVTMYSRAVRQLEDHFKKPAEKVTEDEIRQYFLYNKNDRKWSRTASTIALCGIKFFFVEIIHQSAKSGKDLMRDYYVWKSVKIRKYILKRMNVLTTDENLNKSNEILLKISDNRHSNKNAQKACAGPSGQIPYIKTW